MLRLCALVASARPGAGAELLRRLTHEADGKGWSFVLDASNEKLAATTRNSGSPLRAMQSECLTAAAGHECGALPTAEERDVNGEQ